MDDPFACFGEDSESEDEVIIDENLEKRRLNLLQKANVTRQNVYDEIEDDKDVSEKAEDLLELPSNVDVPFPSPLFLGPIQVVQSDMIGGNRGYIATQDLPPGTLCLVEKPIFEWTEDQIGSELGIVSVIAILQHDDAKNIIQQMESLYPTKTRVDELIRAKVNTESANEKIQIKDMIDIMEMQHSGGKELQKALSLARQNNLEIEEIDIYRLLLAMRYNGFGSGIYLHFAIFNHDNNSNCIKFRPENSSKDEEDSPYTGYSEVRTTRLVRRGEALTIDYIEPREQSFSYKRYHLWDQHKFDIGGLDQTENKQLQELDLIDGKCPPSFKDRLERESLTFHIENALKEFEDQLHEIKMNWALMSMLKDESEEALKLFEHAKALGEAAFELINSAKEKLSNDSHILIIRCGKLYLDVSEIVLEMGSKFAHHFSSSTFANIGGNMVLKNCVWVCNQILPIQIKYYGSFHPDVARTYHDLASNINTMISQCPKVLYTSGIEDYSSFAKCQRLEAEYMKAFKHIDNLYPKDTKQKIVEFMK